MDNKYTTEELTNLELFVDRHVTGPWNHKFQYTLYATPFKRFTINVERSESFDAEWRLDELADRGIFACELDAQHFAKMFIATIGDHLTPRNLEHLYNEIGKELDKWKEQSQKLSVQASELNLWSCDPNEIKPWSPEDIEKLDAALGEVFGWTKSLPPNT